MGSTWRCQTDTTGTIAIGIKVDTTSKLHELDPQVALFICREKQGLEAGEDRMVLDQYAIGYGSGIKFSTRRRREDMFSHAKEQHTEVGSFINESQLTQGHSASFG